MRDWETAQDWYENGVEGLYHEGEEVIATDSWCSYHYAVFDIKGRFIVGEREMKKNEIDWEKYIKYLKKKGIEV